MRDEIIILSKGFYWKVFIVSAVIFIGFLVKAWRD